MQKYTERLGTAPIGALLLRLSLPSMAALLTTSLYNVVDTFWVAKIGYEAIAALTIIFPFQIMFYAIGGGTGIGIGALVSRRFGERNIEATNRAAGQTFFLSALWGLLFILIAVVFSDRMLPLMGATPDIMEYSTQYIVIVTFGAPAMIFSQVVGNLIRGSGDAVKSMMIMVTGCVLNLILDPLMILGLGPFPKMGVSGAALATVIAQAGGAVLALYYLLANKTAFRIKLNHLKPDLSVLKDIYRVGASAAVLQITESLCFILFNKVASTYGSISVAALGMAMRVSDLTFMPIMGLSNALLPIIGFNFGTGNFKRLWRSVKLACLGLSALLIVFTTGIEVFAPQLIGLFSSEPELLQAAIPALRIMISTLVFVGLTLLFITAFQGLSKGLLALFLALARQFIIFIPALYLLSFLLGVNGVWISSAVSDTSGFIISLIFILRELRKRKKEKDV
jgi:putative MATE family efflux protein